MKFIITFSLLLVTISSAAQNVDISGKVIYLEDSTDLVGVNIFLMKEGLVIAEGISVKGGNYEIKNIPIGTYDIKLSMLSFRDKLIPNIEITSERRNFDFVYPNPCKDSNKFCPYGHKDNLIPIIYGLPGEKLMKKAKKGQVKLGGCIVTNCDPKWYCKEHRIEF